MKEASFYERMDGDRVRCALCHHRCRIPESQTGRCGVRQNKGGKLYSLVYGKAVSQNVDPIEKKPLFHLYPGSGAFSIATMGCNFTCLHCQNADISQFPREEHRIAGKDLAPDQVVSLARQHHCRSIAYTYTEPTVFFEYAYDTARLASEAGIKNVWVTNGYVTREALETVHPYLDAANVDLKAFTEDFYREICGARLAPVLDGLQRMKSLGIWVEVTTLIIPSLNDSEGELGEIARFILSLGAETPWHVSAFYPTHRLTDPPRTPVSTLRKARAIGLEAGLRYVYCGNAPGEDGENTYCFLCGKCLIRRIGYRIAEYHLKGGRCAFCGNEMDGIFETGAERTRDW
ncbi:MAG: AmmeMemoRadiSam system radical SAM enzyme [Candidatus Latescibacterota bacterium]